MRVLHVVAPAGVGGLERVVQTLAAAQHHAGDDVHVAALHGLPAADRDLFSDPLRGAGVPIHDLDVPARAYAQERAAVATLATRLRAEVMHTHGYRTDVVDGGVARTIGAAAVSTAHGFTGGGLKNQVYEWMQRRAWRRYEAVAAVSRPLEQRLLDAGVRRDRLHLVVNAWQPSTPFLARDAARKALGVPRDAVIVGWVGRISREKALDVLLDALPGVEGPAPHVVVVGEGPERNALETALREKGHAARVSWCGPVANAARLFAAFDVFALSSRTEGAPMVLFEAMAAGVPVVATCVGGVPDIVSPDEALLVAPEHPVELARALTIALGDRPSALARAARAKERMRFFGDVGAWAERYRAVYESAIAVSRS